jgi:peptide chain release factor 2
MAQSKFWSSGDKDQVIVQVKALKLLVEPWQNIIKILDDLQDYAELLKEEENEDTLAEVKADIVSVRSLIDTQELKVLLGNEEDICNVFLSINAGAGGTESCDWVKILLRMYDRWAERKGFTVKQVDFLAGEEAGVKNVVILISGPYAFGYLKSERGIHRLVRISPFDSNKKRHTSFASVDVVPEIDDQVDIAIEETDLRIDTYRSGGAGGQHVNTTDSAVRITHLPTGVVVQCQNERSQHKNKASAMKMLKSKLYERELQERRSKNEEFYAQKGDIAWGNQIRSYVYQPYTMVKDHRTGVQTGNVTAVMDGDINEFIEGFLKWQAT